MSILGRGKESEIPISEKTMNTNDDQPEPARDENPAAENPGADTIRGSGDSKEALRDLGEAVKKAFQAGAEDARTAARDAIPKAKEDLARGLHDIAYGLAYAVSFSGAVVRELTPESFAAGFEEGEEAGRRAAETMMERRKKKAEASTDETAAAEDAAGESGEPVMI